MSITSARTIFTQTGRHATQSDKMKEQERKRHLEKERQKIEQSQRESKRCNI